MATITSKVTTGNWSTPGSWVGDIAPVPGDRVVIATGAVITATADVTIGDSPADQTTNVLTVNGQLIINSGVNFTIKGNWAQSGSSGSNGLLNCAGNLKIDGTTNSIKYIGSIGKEHSTKAVFKLSGSAGARASFTSLGSGSTNAYTVNGGWVGGGCIEWDYADISNIGDATNNAAAPWVHNSTNLYIRNCTITACGQVNQSLLSTVSTNLSIQNSVWSGSLASTCVALTSNASGTRLIDNNRFDKYVTIYPSTGATVTNNHFDANVGITGYTAASWANNLVNLNGGSGVTPVTATGDYVHDSVANNNPHPTNTNQSSNYDITDFVYDFPAGAVGDFVIGGPSAAPGTYTCTVKRCLSVPNSAGLSSGELVSPLSSGFTYTVEHNTITSTAFPTSNAESGVAVYGETYAGVAGMYASLKSNYVYSPSGKGAFLARHVVGTVSNALASPSAGDYNAGNAIVNATGSGVQAIYGGIGGYADVVGTVTNPMFTWTNGGTPDLAQLGAHDLVANANFVDPTRNLATFDTAYLGNTATAWSSGVAYGVGDIVGTASSGFYGNARVNFRCIAAHTSASGNATNGQPGATGTTSWRSRWELASVYRIRTSSAAYSAGTRQATPKDLWTWVRAGFAPTNTALRGTAHDGTDIGAFAWTASGTYGPFLNFICEG